jgi:gluconokinase
MIVIVMGVAGVGKTTVGKLLAVQLGWRFADADAYHSAANIKKMASGIALTDADREPWLRVLQETIQSWINNEENAVLACSALKESYRRYLSVDPAVRFVFLNGPRLLIEERIRQRTGHYMRGELLESQFASLEEPVGVPEVDVSAAPSDIVREIRRKLAL